MKKKEEFIVREIAGEYIMMPVGSTALKFNGLILANDVSAFIWNNIENVTNAEELASLVCEEYEVSYEEALEDSSGLLEKLMRAGWIEK